MANSARHSNSASKRRFASVLTFDTKRAHEVLETAHTAYESRTHLYQTVHRLNGDAPQRKYRPEGVALGSRDDLIRLYFAAVTDRRQLSSEVYKSHASLWQTDRWLYRPNLAADATAEKIATVLKSAHVGVPNETAKYWLPCSETLYGALGGDPTRLYRSGSIGGVLRWRVRYEKTLGRDPIPGFGPKILSLLAIFYEELGVIPRVRGAFPVDVHTQRICLSTGIVRLRKSQQIFIDSADLAEFIRPRIWRLCEERGWHPLEVAHALWFLGNRTCSMCSKLKDVHVRCPVYDQCAGGLETHHYFRKGKWRMGAKPLPRGLPNQLLF